jgi:tRNA-specific 2-thiouridylase
MPSFKEKILVALSGGVDSAVSALVLLEQGYEIESVYVKTWTHEDDLLGDCPGAQDLKDARAVSQKIGISFRILNLMDFYHANIVEPMVQGYANGITPNPDVLCNREMKFGALLDYALSEGFSALATGHYCQRLVTPSGEIQLWEGKDKNKDQSYFLSRITPRQLKYARFPLGGMEKSEVRRIALNHNLPVATKKDSQGICFLGKVKVPEFLSNFIEDKPGEIVTVRGEKLGEHLGLHRYTLGQRRGIGIPSNTDHQNYVVTGKDQAQNRLIVAFENQHESTLWAKDFEVSSLSFLSEIQITGPLSLLAKARYRDPSTQITFLPQNDNSAEIQFIEPQRALTPGQVLALYRGEQLIGSGIYSLQSEGRASLSA